MSRVAITLVPGDESRTTQFRLLAGLSGWLAFTFFFAPIRAAHPQLPTCPFLALTGHPCPFCGGTRSFAATWHGDLPYALHLYPLGPLLFAGTVVTVAALFVLLATGRSLRVTISRNHRIALATMLAVVLLVQWSAKLLWLGN